MSIIVANDPVIGSEGPIIRSIILFSVLIYELVGPMLTKIALNKAGEIPPKELNPVHPVPKPFRQHGEPKQEST